ncbi:unnamed protein product [Scytosiphon promiscuus]
MDHAERARRRRGNMGGAARVLALGLAIGSWPLKTKGVMAASDLPKAAAGTPDGLEGCRFRVTMWGDRAACERLGGPAGCDELPAARRPGRVQAMVGDVPREASIVYGTEAGTRAWREVLDFGCVDRRDVLSVTLLDHLLRPLAICEVGEAASVQSKQSLVCEGAHGVHFEYEVEHANLPPSLTQPQRALQNSTPTPAPEAADAETPSPVSAASDPDPTEQPTMAEAPDTPGPTPEAEPATDAPVTPDTPAPMTPATAAPVTPATEPPVTPETPAPMTPATSAPVTPATDPPVTATTPAPTPEPTPEPTAEETVEPTPRPVAVTPEPTARPTTEPPVPATTPAPVSPPVATTPEPTVGTPPATDSPVSPQPPPTLEPTVVPVTPAPSRIGTDTPAGQAPVAAPIAPPTQTPASPTAAPVVAPPIAVTSSPSAAESPTSAPGTSTPSAEDDDSDASTTEPLAPPTASPSTAQPVSISPVGSSPRDVTSSPSTIPPTAPVLPPTTETPTSPTDVATPGPSDASVPTLSPDVGATATPATAAPLATTAPPAGETISPAASGTPSPMSSSSSTTATLSPNTAEICTDACIDNATSSDWTHTYYDERCEGKDTSDLAGCNLYSEVDSALTNCRFCIINLDEWEAEGEENTQDYPMCPCCVAASLNLDPQTEKCEEEATTTPAPTPAGTVSIDLTTAANDPDLMMVQFNSEDCSASGIAVIAGTKIVKVTGYRSADDSCGTGFDILKGTECDSDSANYDWDYTTTNFEYNFSCTEAATRLRRRLEDGSNVYTFEAEGSDTLLCNNGETFISLSNLEGDDEGLVYAKTTANGFDTISDGSTPKTDNTYCGDSKDLNTVATSILETGVSNVLEEPDEASDGSEGIAYEYVIPAVCVLLLLMACGCFCCYRHRKGKEGRADQMRRNLGYTPDMEAKGEGNFGPTNKHVAITRGGGAQVTPEMLATKTYTQPTYPPMHHRAPSEAPSSVIEDNIANNYRPKTAAKSWRKRKEHKELTKPASQQHVVGATPTSEDLTAENTRSHSASARSEQLSELSLTKLEQATKTATTAAQPNYGYTFEEVEEDDEDDDARSAATGMSGPSKYAPSGYAPSSHHGGVTHDLMSQYEPSVYEADSQYDPSLYGRESEYGDESSAYSYNDGAASSRRGGYSGGGGGGGRGGRGHISGRASVADTAAMSHLGSVREMDDGGGSAYAASESYVSSYVSSEDDDGRPARSIHPRASHDPQQGGGSPQDGGNNGGGGSNGGYSRHSSHRSGRQQGGGRSGFSASSAGGSSSRHSGARSGFEDDGGVEYDDDDEDESAMGRTPVSMEDIEYYSEEQASSRGGPLTNLEETHEGQRW